MIGATAFLALAVLFGVLEWRNRKPYRFRVGSRDNEVSTKSFRLELPRTRRSKIVTVIVVLLFIYVVLLCFLTDF